MTLCLHVIVEVFVCTSVNVDHRKKYILTAVQLQCVNMRHAIFPRNLAAPRNLVTLKMSRIFSQLIPIHAILEILLHGMGSTKYMYVHVHVHYNYVHTDSLIIEAVYDTSMCPSL